MAAATRACVEAILAAANPGDPPNPVTWSRGAADAAPAGRRPGKNPRQADFAYRDDRGRDHAEDRQGPTGLRIRSPSSVVR
jgi:hypothetical protein